MKKTLILFITALMIISCLAGCGREKNPCFLDVEINGKTYEAGIKLSDMLKNLNVKTEPDILTLKKGQFTKLRLEDKSYNSYYIGILNDTDSSLDYKECKVVYFKTMSVSTDEPDSISFGKYNLETKYEKIIKILGEPTMSLEDTGKKIYVWDGDKDSAACVVFDSNNEYILETTHGMKEYVLDAANIKLLTNDSEDDESSKLSYFDDDFMFSVDGVDCKFDTRTISVADKFDVEFLSLEKDIEPESTREVIAANDDFVFILGLYNDTQKVIKAKEGRFAYIKVTTAAGYELNNDIDYVLHKYPQAKDMTGVKFRNLKLDMSFEDLSTIMSGREEIKVHTKNNEIVTHIWDNDKTRFVARYNNDGALLEFEYGLKGVYFRDSISIDKSDDSIVILNNESFKLGECVKPHFKKDIIEESFEDVTQSKRGQLVTAKGTNQFKLCFVKSKICVNEIIVDVINNSDVTKQGMECDICAITIPVKQLSDIGRRTILLKHDICLDDECGEAETVSRIDMNYGKHTNHETTTENGKKYSVYVWEFRDYSLTIKYLVSGSTSELDTITYSLLEKDNTLDTIDPTDNIQSDDITNNEQSEE